MSQFFRLDRGDRRYLAAILLLTIFSFLPWARNAEFAGMAVFGWMMALLMVFAPAIALLRFFLAERRRKAAND